MPENSPEGYSVTQVTAEDLDLGDYGVVRYSLDDPLARFLISNTSVSTPPTEVNNMTQSKHSSS